MVTHAQRTAPTRRSLAMSHEPGTDDTKFARRWIVLHSRAYGLQPIDQVWVRASGRATGAKAGAALENHFELFETCTGKKMESNGYPLVFVFRQQ